MFDKRNYLLEEQNEILSKELDAYHRFDQLELKMIKRIKNSKVVFHKVESMDNLYVDDKLETECKIVLFNVKTAIENSMVKYVSKNVAESEMGLEIVGYLELEHCDKDYQEIVVDKLFLNSKYRRNGYATKMLERLKEFAKQNEVKKIKLFACAERGIEQRDLIQMYEKCGFRIESPESNRMILEL